MPGKGRSHLGAAAVLPAGKEDGFPGLQGGEQALHGLLDVIKDRGVLFHVAPGLDLPVGQAAGILRAHGIEKISGGHGGALEEVFAFGGALGEEKALSGPAQRVFEAEFVLPGPQGLAAVHEGLDLGGDIVEKDRSSGHDHFSPPQQGVDFQAHGIVCDHAKALFFADAATQAGPDVFSGRGKHGCRGALLLAGLEKGLEQISGVALLPGTSL